MANENTDNISDINFNAVTINNAKYNVNRTDEELNMLHHFDDMMPKYDKTIGAHLVLRPKNGDTKTPIKNVRLGNNVINKLYLGPSKETDKLSDEEYDELFVNTKGRIVDTIIRGAFDKGYTRPSPVQTLAIPEMIQGKDALIQSKSGTGKTSTFLLGCMWGFDPSIKDLQYVFITSTHEVAMQIWEDVNMLLQERDKDGRLVDDGKLIANVALCIGQKKTNTNQSGGFKTPIGTSSLTSGRRTIREEKEQVQRAQIIVCTMGKFYNYLFDRKWINIDYLKALCVDEFDTIVTSKSRSNSTVMDTEAQMEEIIKILPYESQRMFLSATVTSLSLEVAHSYFRPYNVKVGEPFIALLDIDNYTLEGITQYYVCIPSHTEKKNCLQELLSQMRITQCIVFVNRIQTAIDVKNFLDDMELAVESSIFHGGLSSEERQKIISDFKANKVRILISTDVTARGVDITGINLVINLDMPQSAETYVHRIGRSGRYGRKGTAISMILNQGNENNELKMIDQINEFSKGNEMQEPPKDLSTIL